MAEPLRLRGTGRARVAAYGVADAEHLVEKEIARAWPDARVLVTGVERGAGDARIVEEFTVSYRITATLPADTSRAAFQQARALLAGTRYERTEWTTEV